MFNSHATIMVIYICLGLWVIFDNASMLPEVFSMVWHSAFHGHAPVGGFVGSTMLLAAHYGVSRAVYSGDIGIGYDSTIQSETQTTFPEKQARMSVFGYRVVWPDIIALCITNQLPHILT